MHLELSCVHFLDYYIAKWGHFREYTQIIQLLSTIEIANSVWRRCEDDQRNCFQDHKELH